MYKKYLIVANKADKAGINITTELSQFGNFNFYLVDDLINNEVIFTENLDLEKINEYDFIIFASKHKSEKNAKTLSVHAPGNWREAQLGGNAGKVCKTSALFQKQLFERLNANAERFQLKDYAITLECTHHGPFIQKPCIFIEIGSTETEYKDKRAGFVVAKAIAETIETFKENPYNEIAIGIGGPHYCPSFNKIQLKSNIAISHIIPQYVFPLTEDMINEAIQGTEEEVDLFVLDWKGLGTAEQRQDILKILDKFYIQHKRTSEISK